MKKIFILVSTTILLTQCAPGTHGSYRRAERLVDRADENLASYHDEAAWARALTAERIAREQGFEDLLCRSLLIKGRVCDYANVSEESSRDDEALGYLQEAVSLADAHAMMPERVIARYLISEVYVNKNRWKGRDIDSLIYSQAGRWVRDGEAIAEEAGDTLLRRKALSYNLRYLRQGGRYNEAISLCNDIISACPNDDYLMLQQIYDQLTVLYQLTGDDESSLAAHAKYVIYVQKQMSQIEENPKSEAKKTRSIVIAASATVIVATLAASLLTIKESRASGKKKRSKYKTKPSDGTQEVPDLSSLTPREMEIVRLTAEGKSSGEIAHLLSLSQRTVSNHKQNIYRKLGVNSSQELIRICNLPGCSEGLQIQH